MTANGSQKAPKWNRNGPKVRQWGPKRSQKGTKGTPKGAKGGPKCTNKSKVGKITGKRPTIFEKLTHFGAMLGPNLEQFWSPAPSPFRRSCYLLALPLLLPWRPRFSGSAGARVSAYNLKGGSARPRFSDERIDVIAEPPASTRLPHAI